MFGNRSLLFTLHTRFEDTTVIHIGRHRGNPYKDSRHWKILRTKFRTERTLFSKSFYMILWSSKKAVVVGAKGWLGMFNIFGSELQLEPGPDALEFIRDMSGAIAARKFET